ncbi:MAG: AMP-binding protein [Acidobacteriota bacterium]|nr:AMP-binding protein [Acidobacteriota bacterium]
MTDLLRQVLQHAEQTPQQLCVRTHSARVAEGQRDFQQVAEAAGRAAGAWRARGIEPGDLVALIGTHHLDFYASWLGAVWAGAVPTVLAEPSVRIDRKVYWQRLDALLEHNRARHLALDPRYAPGGSEEASRAPSTAVESSVLQDAVITYEELAGAAEEPPPVPDAQSEDLLLLQHSSGTTGLQKGVMLSHGAVLRHARAYNEVLRMGRRDVVASWLPLYHDMGFIACFILPLLTATPVIWLSPFEWVANPGLLLEAVTRHRATLTWLPNFAFSFLAQRVRSEELDLSSLRAVIDCSEPVTTEALEAFQRQFAEHGLRREALQTCYAMAENVFAVTSTSARTGIKTLSVERDTWQREHRAVPTSPSQPREDTVELVSSGVPVPGCRVRIVDEAGAEASPGQAGRIVIHSSFLFDGYYQRPELNQDLFDGDGFYDTGDLGFVDADGHLFVTGRRKDLIIVGGRNVYPQDVEAVASEVAGVKAGRVVCFGVTLPDLGTEGLVLLAETDEPEATWPELRRRLRASVPTRLDLDLFDVRVQPPGRLRKSTSGKLARDGNRQWYLDGRFGPPPQLGPRQVGPRQSNPPVPRPGSPSDSRSGESE